MADNCCNPVIPESCMTKCPQLIDACCVVNEEALPCIIPSVTILDIGVDAGSLALYDPSVSTVLPNPFSGVITVTSPTPGIFAEGTTVKRIVDDTVYLNQAPIGSNKVDVVFSFTEQRQCDINAAIDAKLCCPEFSALDLAAGWTDSDQALAGPGEVSLLNCIVRFRGILKYEFTVTDTLCELYISTLLATPLAVSFRPSTFAQVLSVNVSVLVTGLASTGVTNIYPATLTILPTGVVSLRFSVNKDCIGTGTAELYLSLAGLTYETS